MELFFVLQNLSHNLWQKRGPFNDALHTLIIHVPSMCVCVYIHMYKCVLWVFVFPTPKSKQQPVSMSAGLSLSN